MDPQSLINALRDRAKGALNDANERARGFNDRNYAAVDEYLRSNSLRGPKQSALRQELAESYEPVGMIAAPQAKAMETARKNAVKMLGLPENNTAMDRAKALGFTDDTFHGTFNRFDNFDMSKANPRSQYMPGVFTADKPELAENYGDYIMPLLQRKGTTVIDKLKAKSAGLPAPTVDTIYDKAAGIRVTDNPANIRSRFAAFDPARINENDLLGRADPKLLAATALGAGATVAALRNRKEKKKDEDK